MPARAFVDSDLALFGVGYNAAVGSKCPRGHLLTLILCLPWWYFSILSASKCPRGHLLILIFGTGCRRRLRWSKCPRGHLLILIIHNQERWGGTDPSKCPRGHLLILMNNLQH